MGMWCSDASNADGYVQTRMSNLYNITHIGIEGEPENHVTSFGVKYGTAEDTRESENIELATVGWPVFILEILAKYYVFLFHTMCTCHSLENASV